MNVLVLAPPDVRHRKKVTGNSWSTIESITTFDKPKRSFLNFSFFRHVLPQPVVASILVTARNFEIASSYHDYCPPTKYTHTEQKKFKILNSNAHLLVKYKASLYENTTGDGVVAKKFSPQHPVSGSNLVARSLNTYLYRPQKIRVQNLIINLV